MTSFVWRWRIRINPGSQVSWLWLTPDCLLKGGRFELIYGHFCWWTPFFPLVEASFGREKISQVVLFGILWYVHISPPCAGIEYYTILLCSFQWAFRSPKIFPFGAVRAVRLSDRLAAFRGASGCGACTHIAGAMALDLGAQWGNLPATAAENADPQKKYMDFWGETSGKSWTESFWPRGFAIVPKTRWLGPRYDPKISQALRFNMALASNIEKWSIKHGSFICVCPKELRKLQIFKRWFSSLNCL